MNKLLMIWLMSILSISLAVFSLTKPISPKTQPLTKQTPKVESSRKESKIMSAKPELTKLSNLPSRGDNPRDTKVVPEIKALRELNMRATAYDLSVESCGKSRSHPEYGLTRTGTRATYKRTVAVDPKTIRLGSVLHIAFPTEYEYMTGEYVAEDTGNAVKNDIIDIFFGEDLPGSKKVSKIVNEFGRRKVKVYVIKEP